MDVATTVATPETRPGFRGERAHGDRILITSGRSGEPCDGSIESVIFRRVPKTGDFRRPGTRYRKAWMLPMIYPSSPIKRISNQWMLLLFAAGCADSSHTSGVGAGTGSSASSQASSGQSSGQATSGSAGSMGVAQTGSSATGSVDQTGSGQGSTGSGLGTMGTSTGSAGADAASPPTEGGVSQSDGGAAKPVSGKGSMCPVGPFQPLQPGPAQAVCAGFAFKYNWNEGPTWVPSQGAFFFSNFVRGAAGPGDIIKYTPGGQCETWVTNVGCNGLSDAPNGTLVGVCQTPRAVVAFDYATKQQTMLATTFMGRMLDSPNDVMAISNGTIYFSNPTYELGARPVGIGPAFFYIDPAGNLNLIEKVGGGQPNGVAVSPDEKHLYLEIDGSGVKTYDLDPNGVPMNGPKNFTGGTDGISTDCAGNLYLSGGAIIGPDGKQVGNYPGGTMATFGGADGKTLLVVGGTGVHTVAMNIPGPPH